MSDRNMRTSEYESLAESLRRGKQKQSQSQKVNNEDTVVPPVQSTVDTTTPSSDVSSMLNSNKSADTDTDKQYKWQELALSKRLEPIPGVDNDKWESRKQELANIYKQAKQQKQYGELAETIGQALIQLGAGYNGLKTGTDMSGLKFNRANWEKQYDTLLDELKAGLGDVEHSRAAVERASERDIRASEREQDRSDRASEFNARARLEMAQARIRDKQSADEATARKQDKSLEKQEQSIEKRNQFIEQAKADLLNAKDDSDKNALIKFKDNIVKAGGTAEQAQAWLDKHDGWFSDDYDAMIEDINKWKESLPSAPSIQSNPPSSVPEDMVSKYATTYNISIEQARSILNKRLGVNK